MHWRWMPPAAVADRIARTLLVDAAECSPAWTYPLSDFQYETLHRARRRLERVGGVIVADEVGLGKTYVALALIESALLDGQEVVVVVPAALRGTWAPLLRRVAARSPGNGRSRVHLTTHARLSRGTHDAARLRTADLVVVDEAHAFRNPATLRYRALAERRPDGWLVLITATPVNNGVADLYHLVRQFARDDAFRNIGVASLRACFLDGDGGGEDAARVATAVVVRRTRVDAAAWARESGSKGVLVRFPRRAPAEIIRYDDPRTPPLVREIEALELAPYRAGDTTAANPGVEALVRLGLLKRLESGRPALAASLRRLQRLLFAFEGAANKGRLLRPSDTLARGGPGDSDAIQLIFEELVLDPGRPGVDLAQLAASALRDQARVDRMLRRLAGGDPKLDALRSWLDARPRDEKVVLFTEFRDTAEALWRALAPVRRVGRVDGSGAWLGVRPAARNVVVRRFAPHSSGVAPPPLRERVDLLITTDVLSEGMNLQDAAVIVAYDLPWNPVRLLQRIGRVDRLGSFHDVVQPVLFVPGAGLDDVLRLTRSLRAKLGGITETIGAGDAGDLLARLGGAERARVALEALSSPPDPWERLRASVAGLGTCEWEPGPPLLGAVLREERSRVRVPGAWLVLAREAGGVPTLFEVSEGEVRDAGPAAAMALEAALDEANAPATSGSACALERQADDAIRALRWHLASRAAAVSSPAALARNGPGVRVSAAVRDALGRLGPDPDPKVLEHADAVLGRLARPLDLRSGRALDELVRNGGDRQLGKGRPDGELASLLGRVEAALPTGNGAGRERRGGIRPDPGSGPDFTVLAALHTPLPPTLSGG